MNSLPTSHKILRYEQIANQVTMSIEQGVFRPGDRLPSVRELSRQQGVSISTVLQAYLLLENRGLIEARPQSGYYVRSLHAGQLPEPEISSPGLDPSHVSLNELVMQVVRDTQNPSLAQLGAALPNLELLPLETINRITAALARNASAESHQYQFPPGLEALRVQIARRALTYGCSLAPNDTVTTRAGTD